MMNAQAPGGGGGLRDSRDDAFLLLRFDIVLHNSLEALRINWAQTSLAFRDKKWAWKAERKASDLFFAGPTSHLPALYKAINISSLPRHKNDRENAGAVHWTYLPLVLQLGESNVGFVDEKRHGASSLHMRTREAYRSFLAIERSCRGIDLDLRVRRHAQDLRMELEKVSRHACWRVDASMNADALGVLLRAARTQAQLIASLEKLNNSRLHLDCNK